MQSDLDTVASWLCSSHLCLNVLKSNAMLIGSRQKISNKPLNVSVGGAALRLVSSIRYLGILIDSTLSWSLHVYNIVARVRSRLLSICRYGTLPPAVVCLLYSTFVLPLFDYCDVVWCPTTAKLTSLIERVHSKFVNRLPLPFRSKFSYSLIECRRFHMYFYSIFKSIHQSSISYLHNIFHFSKDITGHVSRNINRLFVPRVSNNFGKRSFYYRGPVLWNSLSQSVVEAISLSSFKRLYFELLLVYCS